MREIKAPEFFDTTNEYTIFLAGSIEMGKAEKWQDRVVKALETYDGQILNPRRDDWDSSWNQSIDDDQFRKQVCWEQLGIENADIVLFYFDITTQSPITLMELGLAANRGNAVVVCPEGYYRKGNVDILCKRHGLNQFETLEEAIAFIKPFSISDCQITKTTIGIPND